MEVGVVGGADEGEVGQVGFSAVFKIVITAKDLTESDRARLNGEVSRILQKGATSAVQLLAEVRALIAHPPSNSTPALP